MNYELGERRSKRGVPPRFSGEVDVVDFADRVEEEVEGELMPCGRDR